jgi:hypothetical protein
MNTNPLFMTSLSAICLFTLSCCTTEDYSGKAVAKQWNSRFDSNTGTSPWTGRAPAMRLTDFVYEGISVKDYEYKKYVDLIRRGTSWSGFGAQTAALGLNAAGTLVAADTTKILSAAAGAINGTSAAFSKNVLFDQSITTFIASMDGMRAVKLAYIQDRLKDPTYGFAEAYRDIEDYGRLGSLDAALAAVGKQSGVQEAVAKGDAQRIPSGPNTSSTATTTTTTTRK